MAAVDFLNECLVPCGKFPGSAREKAWTKFSKSCPDHIDSLTAVTGFHQGSTWLCLQLFEQMLDANYIISAAKHGDCTDTDLGEDSKDIVYHIGGSIVHKLKRRYMHMKSTDESEEMVQCLSHWSQENDDDSRLTTALNRGGLIFLKETPKEFFVLLEKRIRSFFQMSTTGTSSNMIQNYTDMCCQDREILAAFTEMTELEVGDRSKEIVLVSILHLFFKIRVHHECRRKLQMSAAVPSKGLRKSLVTQQQL